MAKLIAVLFTIINLGFIQTQTTFGEGDAASAASGTYLLPSFNVGSGGYNLFFTLGVDGQVYFGNDFSAGGFFALNFISTNWGIEASYYRDWIVLTDKLQWLNGVNSSDLNDIPMVGFLIGSRAPRNLNTIVSIGYVLTVGHLKGDGAWPQFGGADKWMRILVEFRTSYRSHD
jgi:hypothetical protein